MNSLKDLIVDRPADPRLMPSKAVMEWARGTLGAKIKIECGNCE